MGSIIHKGQCPESAFHWPKMQNVYIQHNVQNCSHKNVPTWLWNQSLSGNELIAPLWSNLLVNMCHAEKMMCEKLQISYLKCNNLHKSDPVTFYQPETDELAWHYTLSQCYIANNTAGDTTRTADSYILNLTLCCLRSTFPNNY